MIRSSGSKESEKVWDGARSAKLPIEMQSIGRIKLRMIKNSIDLNDLRIPPSNRLEKLTGKLENSHSIRINDQWRIVFRWKDGHALDVEIKDYHK
jgi:proteic killer suppression protein